LTLHVDPSGHRAECSSSNRWNGGEVDVNDRVNLHVAVKLKVWVDVEVLVADPRSDHDRPEALGSTRRDDAAPWVLSAVPTASS